MTPGPAPTRVGWWRRLRTRSFSAWVREGPWHRQAMRVVALFVALMVLIPGTATAVVLSAYLFLPLPAALPDERSNPASQISSVHAIDGTQIGEFRVAYQAIPIPADEIPDTVRRAVVAVEDHDFFDHDGIDYGAVFRAFVTNLTARRIEQGGSTITQQLVKNLYTGGDRSITRKLREAVFAAQLEREMSKEEILARYLNTIYLGDSVFGIEAAARSYFRKAASDLTLSEAALLAGLIPAPSRYSPRSHPEEAEARRQLVLDQLLAHGLATPEAVAQAREEKPAIHPPPGAEGKYPYFQDYVWRYLTEKAGFTEEEILRGGLRIETTLDPALEDHAIAVVTETLGDPDDPDAAMVAIEPQTGFVRALVGGKDWETQKVNLALGRDLLGRAGTGRQPGSSFKPFVLAQALEEGISPSKGYPGPRCVTIGDWSPCNYDQSGYGTLSLRRAMHRSVNTVFAQLIRDIGAEDTAEMARRLGVDIDPESERANLTIALGSWEVSPLEMASAYSVFAARGMRAEPTPVLRVVAPDGAVLLDHTEPARSRVLREVIADTLNDVLQGVISGGTARRADIGRPAAGKTGTASNYYDAWFVGYTPTLSTAVWMGHAEAQIAMGRETGGNVPARIWAAFMKEALEDVPETDFTDPAPLDTLQDRAQRRERGGFDLGSRKWPSGFGGDAPAYEPPSQPEAEPPPDVEPTTTTTTAPTFPSTTTTTGLFGPTTTTGGGGPGPLG